MTATVDRRPPVGLRLSAAVAGTFFVLPAAYLIWRALTDDADPIGLIGQDAVLGPLRRTLVLAVLVSVTSAVIGTVSAWLVTRTDLPGRRVFDALVALPLVFPTFIGAAAMVRSLNPGGMIDDALTGVGLPSIPALDGLWGAWYVLTIFTYPYVHLSVAARFRRLPGSIEQSARLLGNSGLHVFTRIIVPQARTAITAGTLLVFLYTISDFGAVAILRYDTLTRAIEANFTGFNRPVALALALILLVLAALVVTAERWANARQPRVGTVRNLTPVRTPLGRGRWMGLGFVSILVLAGLVIPVAALLDWSIRGFDRAQRGGRGLTIDVGEMAGTTLNTVAVSAVTAVLAVLAVLPIALLVARHQSRVGSAAHALAIATFALPGLLVALAAKFWILQSDWTFATFDDSMITLIAAYVVRFVALAMGATLVAVQLVPDRFHDVARMAGADPLRRLTSIDLPLIWPGALGAAGLVLLSTMKELPISLLLTPIGFETLATRIFGSFSESFLAEAGLMALSLVVFSFVATWFLIIRPASRD